jgi:predicted NBD/HSP70 family sugar kinase
MTAGDAGSGGPRPLNLLRDMSDQAVLETIFRHGPITRPEIASRTGLSKPTVSDAVRRLMQERLVRSAGVRPGSVGRSPVSYIVDNAAGYVIGLDIGGSTVRAAAVDLYGEVLLERAEARTAAAGDALPAQIISMVRRISRIAGATHSQLLAVGISITEALFDPATQRLTSDLDTEDHPFDSVRAAIGTPVLVDSNINLSAVGEKWRGLAVGISEFTFVSVGESAGLGIVIADEIVRGAHGLAGNLHALPAQAVPTSPDTMSQNLSYAGQINAPGVLKTIQEASWATEPPQSIGELFALAETDPTACEIVGAEASRIAEVVVSVCAILDPELVVLGGGIGSFPEIADRVRRHCTALIPASTRIETSMLREKAALFGALAVGLRDAREQLFRRGNRPMNTAI